MSSNPLQSSARNPSGAKDLGHLRVAQINAENLFLFFDTNLPANWKSLPEKEWQRLSRASVPNKSLKKTAWLAQSLMEIDADLVMVNEVGGEESLSNFARYFLDDKYKAMVIEGNSDRGIDVGYLIKRDLPVTTELHTNKNRPIHFLYPHEIASNAHFEKSAPEKVLKSHYFSRDCAELRVFKPGATSPILVILLVHLKSKLDPDGIDPEGRDRRAAELKTVVEIYIEIRRENPETPMIVAGDFNGIAHRQKGEREFQPLFESTDLENVFALLNKSEQESMTQIQFGRGNSWMLQIDYIFVSEGLKQHLVPEGTFAFRYRSDLGVQLGIPQTLDQRLVLPSDHYPVVATFKNFL